MLERRRPPLRRPVVADDRGQRQLGGVVPDERRRPSALRLRACAALSRPRLTVGAEAVRALHVGAELRGRAAALLSARNAVRLSVRLDARRRCQGVCSWLAHGLWLEDAQTSLGENLLVRLPLLQRRGGRGRRLGSALLRRLFGHRLPLLSLLPLPPPRVFGSGIPFPHLFPVHRTVALLLLLLRAPLLCKALRLKLRFLLAPLLLFPLSFSLDLRLEFPLLELKAPQLFLLFPFLLRKPFLLLFEPFPLLLLALLVFLVEPALQSLARLGFRLALCQLELFGVELPLALPLITEPRDLLSLASVTGTRLSFAGFAALAFLGTAVLGGLGVRLVGRYFGVVFGDVRADERNLFVAKEVVYPHDEGDKLDGL